MTDRILCQIPYCRRTASAEKFGLYAEIICGKHWRTVPLEMRRRYAKLRRLYRRRQSEELASLCDRQWDRCKAEAVAIAANQITDASVDNFLRAL